MFICICVALCWVDTTACLRFVVLSLFLHFVVFFFWCFWPRCCYCSGYCSGDNSSCCSDSRCCYRSGMLRFCFCSCPPSLGTCSSSCLTTSLREAFPSQRIYVSISFRFCFQHVPELPPRWDCTGTSLYSKLIFCKYIRSCAPLSLTSKRCSCISCFAWVR